MSFDALTIGSVFIHDVPRGRDELEQIVLTDEPIELDPQLRRYFHDKIIVNLERRGVDVVADGNEKAEVRQAVARIIRDEAELASQSQRIAQWLYAVQTARNPAGLLAVIRGELEGKPVVSIVKLEREQGVRCHVTTAEGHSVISVELLRDLTLTDTTKVYKTALLEVPELDEPRSLHGHVSDGQRQQGTGPEVASFFLRKFLGCKVAADPARVTAQFFDTSLAFFNKHVPSQQKRGRYLLALTATLQDQQLDVQPQEFAAQHLDDADQPGFMDFVRDAGVEPTQTFQKDVSLVPMNKIQIVFESGILVVGTPADIDAHVQIRPETAAVPGAEINDPIDILKTLKGR